MKIAIIDLKHTLNNDIAINFYKLYLMISIVRVFILK